MQCSVISRARLTDRLPSKTTKHNISSQHLLNEVYSDIRMRITYYLNTWWLRSWPSGRILALYEVGQVHCPVKSYQRLEKWCMLFPCLAFSILEKSMWVKHTVLPDGQPPTVAFTVLAQLCVPKANETEIGAALFTKKGEGRNFNFF